MKREEKYHSITIKFIWQVLICSSLLYAKVAADSSNIPTSNQVLIVEEKESPNGSPDSLERLKDHLNILKSVWPLSGNAIRIDQLKQSIDEGENGKNRTAIQLDSHNHNNKTDNVRSSSPVVVSNPSLLQIHSHIPFIPKIVSIGSVPNLTNTITSSIIEFTSSEPTLTLDSLSTTQSEVTITASKSLPLNPSELQKSSNMFTKVTETSISTATATETVTHYIIMTTTTQQLFTKNDSTEYVSSSFQIKTPLPSEVMTKTAEPSIETKFTTLKDSGNEFERLEKLIHELRKEVLDQRTSSSSVISSFSSDPLETPTSISIIESENVNDIISPNTAALPSDSNVTTEVSVVPTLPHVSYIGTTPTLDHVEKGKDHTGFDTLHGKSGKDLLNMKSPSYKVDIAPQFQYHGKTTINQLLPSIPYSKPKVPFVVQPVSPKEIVVDSEYETLTSITYQNTISSSTEEATPESTTVNSAEKVEIALESEEVDITPQLPSEDLNTYLKRIYPMLKKVMEEEQGNITEEVVAELMDSTTEVGVGDYNSIYEGNKTVPHNEPYKIYHVPKEMQHEVINNAFKTFNDAASIKESYEKGRKDIGGADNANTNANANTNSSKSTIRKKSNFQSAIDFDVFGDSKESGGVRSHLMLRSIPSYTAIVAIIALSIWWI